MSLTHCNFILKSFSIKKKSWFYKAEGNSSIVLALPETHKIIRIRKYESKDINLEAKELKRFQHDFFYYKYIYPILLHPNLLSTPEFILIPTSEVDIINENIENLRPESRRKKKLYSGLALLFPDFTQSINLFNKSKVVTVEIKPKQGHFVEEDRLNKCKFCIKQNEKMKSKSIKEISHYCPLDLYSGNFQRMFMALISLFNNPQNNLKIFEDGELKYSELQNDKNELVSLISRLFDPFLPSSELINVFITLILESLLRDISDTTSITSLNINEIISFEDVKYKSTIQFCNWNRETLKEYSVLNLLLRMQKLNNTPLNAFTDIGEENDDLPCLPDFISNPNSITFEDIQILPKELRYLLFTTAADCSIMLSFKKISHQDMLLNEEKKDFQLFQIKDTLYMFRAKIVDLDIKSKSRIASHYKKQILWKKYFNK